MTRHNLKLTNIDCLRPLELTLDESVLELSAEIGHSQFWGVKRNVRVALVVASLNSNLEKTFI